MIAPHHGRGRVFLDEGFIMFGNGYFAECRYLAKPARPFVHPAIYKASLPHRFSDSPLEQELKSARRES